jgi:hypothetical protein
LLKIVCGDCWKKTYSGGCSALDDEDDDLSCGSRRGLFRQHNKNISTVPSMIGNTAWFAGSGDLPTAYLTRPNVVEHFNAVVQNRFWADYRHWNNAASMGGESRGVDQFSFGAEKQILRRNSVEIRVPFINQFASKSPTETALELGNVSVFLKRALRQGPRWTSVGGFGATLPTAKNWLDGGVIQKNDAYYLTAFFGAQWHPNKKACGHVGGQADLPIKKKELSGGGNLTSVGGVQILRTGVQSGRWIYNNEQDKRPCRLGVFAEVNYAVITDSIPQQFDSRQSFTAAVGVPVVFGKLTAINSLVLPIPGYDRPSTVGYNLSLTRQF